MKNEVTGHEDDYKRKLEGTIDSLLHDFPHGLERYRISQVLHGNSSIITSIVIVSTTCFF